MKGTARRLAQPRHVVASRRRSLAAALAALVSPRAAAAQTHQELATRRVLIERATAERAAGHHADALALAQSAGAVQMTPSVRLFIAQEMDATGDPAGALGMADLCVREVERDRAVAHRAALLTTCRELAASARARVGYVVVRAPTPAPEGLRVTLRGAPLNPALLGVPNVVSPGVVTVEASAPGRRAFSASREVGAGATVQVDLELATEPLAPPPSVIASPPAVVEPPRVVTAPPIARPAVRTPNRLAPALLLGGGAAAIASGVALLLVREAALDGCTVSDGAAECDTQPHLEASRTANELAASGGVLLGVGVAAVGAGVAWLLLDRGAPSRPVQVTMGVVPSSGGVAFGLAARLP